MGRLLKRLARVPWGSLEDSSGTAEGIPRLLATAAWGGGSAAELAIDELGDRICSLGFVVSEATPQVVPFLLELVGDGTGRARADVLILISRIYSARQWETAASAASPKSGKSYEKKVAWEAAGRNAVSAGTAVLDEVTRDPDPVIADLARQLLAALE